VSSDTKGRVSISSNDSSSAKNSRPSKNFGTSKNDDSNDTGMVLKICLCFSDYTFFYNLQGKNKFSSVHSDKSSVDSEHDGGDEYGETTQLPEDAGFMEKIAAAVKKGSNTLVRAFVDYGPPYSDDPYSPVLGDTCAKPVANHFKIHNILNRRWNPNQADPNDFYYYPIHWYPLTIGYTEFVGVYIHILFMDMRYFYGLTLVCLQVRAQPAPNGHKDALSRRGED